MSKNEKVILLGGSGSGKDFLMRKLSNKNLKACIKITTRPPRINEENMVDYNFVNNEEFIKLIEEEKMLVYQKFEINGDIWYYGITKEEFNESDVFIMTPDELSKISEDDREMSFVVYLDIDRKIREKRLHNRKDKNDLVKRRLDSDELDFLYFSDFDLKVTDPEFSADDIYSLMI